MTTSIIIDGSRAPEAPTSPAASARREASAPSAPVGFARLSFGGIMRSERIKLSSLRSIRITLIATVVVGLAMSGLIAFVMHSTGDVMGIDVSDPAAAQSYLLTLSTFGAQFLALVFGVLGVFAIASEYSSGMILSTLAAVPRRTPVLVAKALVLSAVSAIAALIIVGGGLGFAVAFEPASAAQIASVPVVSGVLGTVVYLVLVALFAFGVAALLRSTAGGISVAIGAVFVLPIVFQMLSLTGWEWVNTASAYIPVALGSTLGAGIVDPAPETGPGYWVSLAAMIAWAAAAVVPAAFAFKRRDAK